MPVSYLPRCQTEDLEFFPPLGAQNFLLCHHEVEVLTRGPEVHGERDAVAAVVWKLRFLEQRALHSWTVSAWLGSPSREDSTDPCPLDLETPTLSFQGPSEGILKAAGSRVEQGGLSIMVFDGKPLCRAPEKTPQS